MAGMAVTPESFWEELVNTPSAVDPHGVHSEFVSGMHGRKINFDGMPTESSLFRDWVDLSTRGVADYLVERGMKRWGLSALTGVVLLGVANGTNRLVEPVASEVGFGIVPLQTYKSSPKSVALDVETEALLRALEPQFVLAVEDVGTSGTTSATAVEAAWRTGASWVEVLNTVQRRDVLEELTARYIVYSSIISTKAMRTYTAEECQKTGYCADGWEFVEHAK